jgi:hypothetical protein
MFPIALGPLTAMRRFFRSAQAGTNESDVSVISAKVPEMPRLRRLYPEDEQSMVLLILSSLRVVSTQPHPLRVENVPLV